LGKKICYIFNQSVLVITRSGDTTSKGQSKEMAKKTFGFELIMDLSECDLEVMSSKKKLTEYVDTLCKLIDMKKYGKVQLPYFGLEKPQTKGYSLIQFIETSSIVGHFSEHWKMTYLNVFSCKPYDYKLAAKFTKEFFKAAKIKVRYIVR
jgi:S-adenosylmethionine/arginine decarboxylase-like enzyme